MLDTLVRETIAEFEGQTSDRPVVLRAEIPDRDPLDGDGRRRA